MHINIKSLPYRSATTGQLNQLSSFFFKYTLRYVSLPSLCKVDLKTNAQYYNSVKIR